MMEFKVSSLFASFSKNSSVNTMHAGGLKVIIPQLYFTED